MKTLVVFAVALALGAQEGEAAATCSNKDGAGAKVTDAECGVGFVYDTDKADTACAADVCAVDNGGTDQETCCKAVATCGDKDGAGVGDNVTAVTDEECGVGFVYDTDKADTACASDVCAVDNGGTDQETCCVAVAKCGDKDGAGVGDAAVTDEECGAGFVYDAAKADTDCASDVCAVTNVGTDRDKCCKAVATCGDKNGAGVGDAAVTDEECGAGFFYDSASETKSCAGAACAVGTGGADRATCCTETTTTGAALVDGAMSTGFSFVSIMMTLVSMAGVGFFSKA